MNNKKWMVNLSCSCILPENVSLEELEKAILSVNDEKNLLFNKEHKDSVLTLYPNNEVVKFQMDKSDEFYDKYRQNIKISSLLDKVYFNTNFDIEVPSDWDKMDIIEWSEGINRCIKAYLSLIPVNYKDILKCLKDLEKSQIFKINRIK